MRLRLLPCNGSGEPVSFEYAPRKSKTGAELPFEACFEILADIAAWLVDGGERARPRAGTGCTRPTDLCTCAHKPASLLMHGPEPHQQTARLKRKVYILALPPDRRRAGA